MAQTSDSQPAHPTIVFRVNLETLNRNGWLPPNRTSTTGDETIAEADSQKNARSTFIPGLTGGENRIYSHNEQFTVKGAKAAYLKRLHVTGSVDDLLVVVSES